MANFLAMVVLRVGQGQVSGGVQGVRSGPRRQARNRPPGRRFAAQVEEIGGRLCRSEELRLDRPRRPENEAVGNRVLPRPLQRAIAQCGKARGCSGRGDLLGPGGGKDDRGLGFLLLQGAGGRPAPGHCSQKRFRGVGRAGRLLHAPSGSPIRQASGRQGRDCEDARRRPQVHAYQLPADGQGPGPDRRPLRESPRPYLS